MRAVFIRHGQSIGNAGVRCHNLASIELTDLGWRQAREIARAWTKPPTLIVTSPYLRTRQTAEATIQRFPDVLVDTHPASAATPIAEPHRSVLSVGCRAVVGALYLAQAGSDTADAAHP